MTLTRRVAKQRSIKEVRVTTFEVLSDGQTIPIYEPVQQSKRIRARKYKEAIGKYTKDLLWLLTKGYSIIEVKDIKNGPQPSDEEKLLRYTHKLLVIEKEEKAIECLVTCTNRLTYKQYDTSDSKRVQHQYISDDNGIAIILISCDVVNEVQIKFDLNITYINLYSFVVKTQKKTIKIDNMDKIKFELMLSRGYLCIVWTMHNFCSIWDFTDEEENVIKYLQFDTIEELSKAYHIFLDHEQLAIITKDDEFLDSVFSSDNSSQRMTSYYCCKTGARFNTKSIIGQVISQDQLEHVSDILYLDIPFNPKWMVLEWLLPDMTLSQVIIYKKKETGELEKDGVFNFQNEFSEYKQYFGKLNELQCKVFIIRSPWRAFLWISWNHVMIIDLSTYEIVGILKTDLSRYKDFKNEIYDFDLEVCRTAHRVTLFVKHLSEIVYFCRFNLVPTHTLKQLAMKAVIENHSPCQITKMNLEAPIKAEILDAY